MLIKLHGQATTTPKVRAAIQASHEPARVLAERHGTTEQTVWKWRKRDGVEDHSHRPHRLQTTLTLALCGEKKDRHVAEKYPARYVGNAPIALLPGEISQMRSAIFRHINSDAVKAGLSRPCPSAAELTA
ncbi:MAG: hypothetical protein GDA35_06885 [Hyphomonadaceae bacterium]|nr:hypothetical protein [Hyphomonadaceae bacterium]